MRQHFYYTRGVSVQHNVMLAAHIADVQCMDQPSRERRKRDENGEKWEWRPLRPGDEREIRIFLGNGDDEDAYALENCNVDGVVLATSLCGVARDAGCVIANVISVKDG